MITFIIVMANMGLISLFLYILKKFSKYNYKKVISNG